MAMCLLVSLDQRKVDSARLDREMAQLRKVTRKKDNQIKSLQSDARRRELVLKRRQEEVCIYVESTYPHVHNCRTDRLFKIEVPVCMLYLISYCTCFICTCSLQLFADRRGFRLGVPRLHQPNLPVLREVPVGLWLPLPQLLLYLHSQCSLAPPPPLDPATLPPLSSDINPQQTAQQVPLTGTVANENLQCLVLTVQGRNGGTWKER